MPIGAAEAAQQEKLALQMTPMIDVVFQLLIFFVVTLSIPKEEAMIETELPRARGGGEVVGTEPQVREEFEDILLSIVKEPVTGRARIYVNNQWMMNSRQLLGRLEMFRSLNEKGRVVVQCGDDVPYKDLIEAISIVQIAELPMAFANLK